MSENFFLPKWGFVKSIPGHGGTLSPDEVEEGAEEEEAADDEAGHGRKHGQLFRR
jgi:hypothetical protein